MSVIGWFIVAGKIKVMATGAVRMSLNTALVGGE